MKKPDTKHLIVNGDSRVMDDVGNKSVQLVVTSPPYWQLKDYGSSNQIGFNDTYEEYINNLNLVWNECCRVLENGCRLCVNIGDQFARSVYYGRYKVIPIRTEIIKFCETIGFDYMGAIIWQKVTTTNTTGGATIMGSFPYPRNGILKIDYEFILLFKKGGKPIPIDKERKEESKLTKEEWNTYFTGHWNFAGEKQNKHLAMFPPELPKRLIKMFTFVGDTVLDPFLGSGTTSLVASQLGRNSIGYEINWEIIPVINGKLGCDDNTLFKDSSYHFCTQSDIKEQVLHCRKELPYSFKDTVKMDRKVDPKKLQYGSKIDGHSGEREEYFSVKDIISPEILLLTNGLRIRLIGVKENKTTNGSAISFLKNILRGQKIFLKHDEIKYDKDNNLFCYAYLKNKTFINMHLIKNRMVLIDKEIDYKYKDKFLKLLR